jgi:hypothetical protein
MRAGKKAEAEGNRFEGGPGPGGGPLSDRMILSKPSQLLQFDHVLLPSRPGARDNSALHVLIGIVPEILPR